MGSSRKNKLLLALILSLSFLLTGTVAAAEKGGTPNGKPFQAIEDKFDSNQAQIDAINAGIDDLQEQIDEWTSVTTSLLARVALNEQLIANLESDNVIIKADIDQIVADLQDLGEEVDINAQGIQTLVTQHQINTAKIDYLQSRIDDLDADMETKQDILDAQCSTGSALREILADGTVVCETIPQTTTAGFTTMSFKSITEDITLPDSTRYCQLDMGPLGCWDWSSWSTPHAYKAVQCDQGWTRISGGLLIYSPGGSTLDWHIVANYSSRNTPNAC